MSKHDLVSIEEEPDSRRRQVLKYMLAGMAAAAWAPSSAVAFLDDAHQHRAGEKQSKSSSKRRPLITGKPAFFKGNEYKALARMVDLIIPRTETPGAADAGVPLYIDIVAGADAALGERLRKGLTELETVSRGASGKGFVRSTEKDQIKTLQSMLPKGAPGNGFFETVKAMTLVGYYSSEIGLHEELHYVGNQVLTSFKGCPHGGHSLDQHAKRVQRASIQDLTRRWPFPSSDNIVGEDQ